MEFALIVWLIGIVKPLTFFFFMFGFFTFVGVLFYFGYLADQGKELKFRYLLFPIPLIFIGAILPSEKTGYMMVAAYATQKVAESSTAQEMSSDILRIVKAKVKEYADDSENKTKEKPVEKGAK